MNISQIDRNFEVQTSLNVENIKFYDPLEAPFTLYGLFYADGHYRRIPEEIAKTVSQGVYSLHTHTAGGRIKFITNSSYVAIHAKMPAVGKMPHFALTGSSGFDLYVGRKEEYFASFAPPFTIEDGYESLIKFPNATGREITINFPLYSSVSKLYVGLEEGAYIKKSSGYKHEKPIVYYGSSITQGGCATRPGSTYQSILSRALQTDFWNLGFAGNAKGEDEIAQYISGLDMSVFVYDYDHNAPTLAHLEATHQKMFMTIREKNPDLPIIILSRPKFQLTKNETQRLAIIEKTYTDALAAGDKNVYFIDGPTMMKPIRNEGNVDACHPNDLGFAAMAKALLRKLKPLL